MEMGGRYLMLVSARAGARLREDVGLGRRPCPEYLRLEQRHGVELLDWSRLRSEASGRSVGLSVAHARTALRRLDTVDAVFSDGEHLGVPLALAMRLKGLSTPHLMLGHHLTTRARLGSSDCPTASSNQPRRGPVAPPAGAGYHELEIPRQRLARALLDRRALLVAHAHA